MNKPTYDWPVMAEILGKNLRNLYEKLGDMRALLNVLQEQTNIATLYPWACGWVEFRLGYLEAILEIAELDAPEETRLEKLAKLICTGFGNDGTHYRDIFKHVDENRETLHFLICHAPLLLKKTPARHWLYDLDKFFGDLITFFQLEPPYPKDDGPYPFYGEYPRPWPEKNHPASIVLKLGKFGE